jgi:hypothetical protein
MSQSSLLVPGPNYYFPVHDTIYERIKYSKKFDNSMTIKRDVSAKLLKSASSKSSLEQQATPGPGQYSVVDKALE